MDLSNLQKENDRFNQLMRIAEVGWWEADMVNEIYTYSGVTAEMLSIDYEGCPIPVFNKMIREDYRSRVTHALLTVKEGSFSKISFPLRTAKGDIWVETRQSAKEKDGDKVLTVFGSIQSIEDPEKNHEKEAVISKFNNLFHQQKIISQSLISFLTNEDISKIIAQTLNDMLTQFSADRVFVIEYDWENKTQSCLYEAVSNRQYEIIDKFQNISLELSEWWDEQILQLKPIVISQADAIPDNKLLYLDFFKKLGVQSTMIVPLISSNNEVWGYAGIDTITLPRQWINEDFLWFSSIINMINVCMQLRKSESQIKQDKEYLQNLYRYMPIGFQLAKVIYENDQPVDYEYIEVNEEVERLSGYTSSHLIGRRGSLQEKEAPEELERMIQVVNTNKHIEYDFKIQEKDIHCRVVMFSPQEDHVVSLLLDVTDTHHAHRALEKSEQLLRNIYAGLPVGLEVFDKNGILIEINEKDVDILGFSTKDDILGVNIFNHPILPLEVKERMKKGEKMDFRSSYEYSRVLENYYKRLPKRKGVMNMTTKIVPVFDKNNQIQNYIFINIDETETTNAYIRIQEFEEYFSLIADFAKVGYFKWNLMKKEGFAISQWFKNLGKSPNTLITENIKEVYENLEPEDFKVIDKFYAQALKGDAKKLQREVKVIGKEGESPRWLRCTLVVKEFDPANNNIEIIGVSIDITELKEMILAKDKAEALDRLKSAFLASMSHEIRTPLNAIVGFSDMLCEIDDPDERQEYVDIIRHNNDLLLKLISDILDLSKIEADMFELTNCEISLKALSHNIISSMKIKETEQVKLLFNDKLPDITFRGDPDRIAQVVSNLINNALKFTHKGYVSYGYELRNKNQLYFYVEDTGIGIPAEDLNKIFDRFVKLDTFVQGTGLGLPVSKSIVEQMGGNMGVESKIGVGSRFWFTLPL
ncbi:PAS domain-containing protein [Bacteroides sp. OttesenSCG-928-N06]|nr:PAS domain-containing protein [Bacteroides sp. OttesenSCG-928-N06]